MNAKQCCDIMTAIMLAPASFTKIGVPYPEVMGPLVGTVEIVCGILVLLALLTRACLPSR